MTTIGKLRKTLIKLLVKNTNLKTDYLETLLPSELEQLAKQKVFKNRAFRMWTFDFYQKFYKGGKNGKKRNLDLRQRRESKRN